MKLQGHMANTFLPSVLGCAGGSRGFLQQEDTELSFVCFPQEPSRLYTLVLQQLPVLQA